MIAVSWVTWSAVSMGDKSQLVAWLRRALRGQSDLPTKARASHEKHAMAHDCDAGSRRHRAIQEQVGGYGLIVARNRIDGGHA